MTVHLAIIIYTDNIYTSELSKGFWDTFLQSTF